MATPASTSAATGPNRDGGANAAWRYQKDLPAKRDNFAKAWKLFEGYGNIPPDQIEAHVTQVVSAGAVSDLLNTFGCQLTSPVA
jgi:hypothetical protein